MLSHLAPFLACCARFLCSHLNGSVYVGLGSGVLVVFEAYEALQSRPRWSVTVGSAAVRCCTCVLGEVWIGSGNTLYRVDPINHTLKVCHKRMSDNGGNY